MLQAIAIDYIDESEVLTPADEAHHVDKHAFTVPFVCGARDLGEALRRIGEGAAMVRPKAKQVRETLSKPCVICGSHRRFAAHTLAAAGAADGGSQKPWPPVELVRGVNESGRLPVVNFAAGGVATPADAALMMQLGADGCSSARGVFKSDDPAGTAKAIVEATTHYENAGIIAEASKNWPGDEGS